MKLNATDSDQTRGSIIALTGAKGCGKSTLAELIEIHVSGTIRMSFADPIKMSLAAIGVPDKYLWDPLFKEEIVPGFGKTGRYMMQTLGTQWGRDLIDQDIWAHAAARRFTAALEEGYNVVVDDMRFPNEFEMVKAANGSVVRIVRSGLAESSDGHSSEANWMKFDYDFEVPNNGGPREMLEAFWKGVRRYMILKEPERE